MGRRVQNSVFECILDNAQCVMLKAMITDLIDKDVDSLRFYYLEIVIRRKIEHVGVTVGFLLIDIDIIKCGAKDK